MWFTWMWIVGISAVLLGALALIEHRRQRGIVGPPGRYGRERRKAIRAEGARSTRHMYSGGSRHYGYGGGDGGGFDGGGGFGGGDGGGCGDGGGGGC